MFHFAAARPAGPYLPPASGPGTSRAGGLRSFGGGGAGIVGGRWHLWTPLVRWELAAGGFNDGRFSRHSPPRVAGLPDRLPARLEAGDRPRQRPGIGRGVVSGVLHPGTADGGLARPLPLGRGVLTAQWVIRSFVRT